jgi:hypothetical protein
MSVPGDDDNDRESSTWIPRPIKSSLTDILTEIQGAAEILDHLK